MSRGQGIEKMTETLSSATLVARLSAPHPARRIVAIAGAPGSGKSTLADRIVTAANAAAPGSAALCPMDGYHYDDAVLHARGRRPWKGAPDTFDVGGLRNTLMRLRKNDEDEVAVPVFDRSIEIARAGGAIIPSSVRLVVCEGNYVLLDQAPWDSLAPLWDMTVMVSVAEDELRRRLTARWVHYGLNAEEIAHKLDGNDLPNGRRVMADSRPADIMVQD
jgi:pantothenate kinase